MCRGRWASSPSPNVVGDPSGLTVESFTYNSSVVSWTRPSGAQARGLSGFQVQYKKKGAAQWTDRFVSGQASRTTLTGLDANTRYEWQVYSVGGRVGSVQYTNSQPVSGTDFQTARQTALPTPGALPAPTALTTREVTFAGATLSATVPTGARAGAILRYAIEYQIAGALEWEAYSGVVQVRGTTITAWLSGLEASTTYRWRIRSSGAVLFPDSAWATSATFDTPARSLTQRAAAIGVRRARMETWPGNQFGTRVRVFFGNPTQSTRVGTQRIEMRGRKRGSPGWGTNAVFNYVGVGSSSGFLDLWRLARTNLSLSGRDYFATVGTKGQLEIQVRALGAPGYQSSGWSSSFYYTLPTRAPDDNIFQPGSVVPPPAPPAGGALSTPDVSATGAATSIAVSWTDSIPANQVDQYEIGYKLTSASGWSTVTASRTANSREIRGLRAGRTYDIRVRAKVQTATPSTYNDSAYGTAQATTGSALTTPSVSNVPAETSAVISWSASSPLSQVASYQITYRRTDVSGAGTLSTTAGKNDTSTTLTGLDQGAAYLVRVRAIAITGTGATHVNSGWGSTSFLTIDEDEPVGPTPPDEPDVTPPPPPDVPDEPDEPDEPDPELPDEPEPVGTTPLSNPTVSVTPGQDTAVVNFSGVTPAANIEDFQIWYRLTSVSAWTMRTADATDSSLTLTGLIAGRRPYRVQVRARAVDGSTSGHSAWVERTFRTLDRTPLTTPSVSADADLTSVTLTATGVTPSDNISSYIFYYRKTTESQWTPRTSTSTSVTITGLDPDTNYAVQVRAIARANTVSSNSELGTASFRTDAPIQLSTPTLTLVPDETYIDASWTAATPSGGVRDYLLRWKRSDESAWTTRELRSTSYRVPNLDSGTSYNFSLVARANSGYIESAEVAMDGTTDSAGPTKFPAPIVEGSVTIDNNEQYIELSWSEPSIIHLPYIAGVRVRFTEIGVPFIGTFEITLIASVDGFFRYNIEGTDGHTVILAAAFVTNDPSVFERSDYSNDVTYTIDDNGTWSVLSA